MDVPGPRESDPLAGADGTAPPPPETDPASGRAHPSDLRLPPTDAEGVARWMDDDRERALAPWTPAVRDVPPPRPLPAPRRHRTLPPETTDATAVPGGPPEDESAWRRERREEAEFRAQFGEWRPDRAGASSSGRSGMGRPTAGGVLGGVRLGAPLLVLIAVLIAVAALALHL